MILHGDCIQKMKGLEENSIDLTVTSPPYDNLRNYNGSLDWSEKVWKEAIRLLYKVTKDGGVVVWVVGDATIKGSETGTSFKQALWAIECGFNLHDTMIWNKGTFTAVGSLKTRYAPVFEYMFIFSNGRPKTFNPIKDRINKSYGRKHHGTIRQKDGSTRPLANIGKKIPQCGQRFNIWKCFAEKSNSKRFHPAMFPEKLAEDHILSWSNKGDLVLDPFAGSGTTGLACQNTDRDYILIEKEPEYIKIAEARLKFNSKQTKLI